MILNYLVSLVMQGKKSEYKEGQKIGECIFLKETPIGKNSQRRALFKCKCNNEFVTFINAVKTRQTKSCGCRNVEMAILTNTIHGCCYHKAYNQWQGILARCYKKQTPQYKDYGGRGIRVCKEWIKNPKLFMEYVESLPNYGKKGHSLDRINNDGNYEPGNMRWTTSHEQSTNRRKRKDNKSGFVGVRYDKRINKWESCIRIHGKLTMFGYFKKNQDAVNARNNYIIKNGLWEYAIQNAEVA